MSASDGGDYVWDGTRLVPRHAHVQPEREPRWFRALGRERLFAVVVPLLFVFVGLGVYGAWLGTPDEIVFDEVHYLKAARNFTAGQWMNPDWSDSRPHNWEHPPLPKFEMAASIALFGDEPASWRIPSVLNGALGLAGMSVLARRWFRSDLAAVVAPGLLLVEPMWYTHSRLALLDIYVAAPMVWAFAFAFGRQRWAPWAAGGAFALAFAAKYSALFLLPPLALLLLWRGLDRHRLGMATARTVLQVVAVPFAFLFVLQAPFLWTWAHDGGVTYAVTHWWDLMGLSFSWGAEGPKEHPEATAPLYWLAMVRPTWYHVWWGPGSGPEREFAVIYAIGNPVIWWGGLLLAGALVVPPALRAVRALHVAQGDDERVGFRLRRIDRTLLAQLGGVLAVFIAGFLPFFLLSRATYLYYMLLLVPYLALLAAGALVWLLRVRAAPRVVQAMEAEVAPAPAPTPRVPTAGPPQAQPRRPLPDGGQAWARLVDWWWGPWPARAAAGLFLLAAYALAVYWAPLFTGFPTTKGVTDEAWSLVPWMERIIKPG